MLHLYHALVPPGRAVRRGGAVCLSPVVGLGWCSSACVLLMGQGCENLPEDTPGGKAGLQHKKHLHLLPASETDPGASSAQCWTRLNVLVFAAFAWTH